jgi:hypothetical protein
MASADTAVHLNTPKFLMHQLTFNTESRRQCRGRLLIELSYLFLANRIASFI